MSIENEQDQRSPIKSILLKAKLRGGECLIDPIEIERIRAGLSVEHYKFTFRCRKYHTFALTGRELDRHGWCPQCNAAFTDQLLKSAGKRVEKRKRESKREKFEKLQNIGSQWGYQCLSNFYVGPEYNLRWRCENGHLIHRSETQIYSEGLWCPHCGISEKEKQVLAKLAALAESRGGKLTSKRLIYRDKCLSWRCKQGHRFQVCEKAAIQGAWCRRCKSNEEPDTFDSKGRVVPRSRRPAVPKDTHPEIVIWSKCEWGHRFKEVKGSNILRCPQCANQKAVHKDDLPKIEKMSGFRCRVPPPFLSGRKVAWACRDGHHLIASVDEIRKGRQCLACLAQQKKAA